MIDALTTKQLLQAMKLHFTTEKYDAVKYNFNLKAPTQKAKQDFLRNNQRHLFGKVGRHSDPKGLMIANLLENPKLYVPDLLTPEAEQRYLDWKGRQTRLMYLLKQDLELDDTTHNILKVDENGMPFLLNRYIRKQVTPETVVIVDSFAHKLDQWATSDHPLVSRIQLRLRKYRSFVTFDKERARKVIKDLLQISATNAI